MSWVPLESNPEVMNALLCKLGVPRKWGVVDVYGLDDDLLAIVPQPVLAVILLYPVTETSEKLRLEDEARTIEKGQIISDQIWFMRQYISNACGTIALIHSVFNNYNKIELEAGPLLDYYNECKGLSPEEKGQKLSQCDGIASIHAETSTDGQTQAPDASERVDYHFVAFVEKDGSLYELDGRKPFPVNHSESSSGKLMQDAAKVIKSYMARDPDNINFTIVALTSLVE